MLGQLAQEHIKKRLKTVHGGGIAIMLLFLGLLYLAQQTQEVDTFPAQMIVLTMTFLIALGYLSVLPDSEEEPKVPLFLLYLLNFLTSALVWATGVFQSPFILLYAVFIIIAAQLYSYRHGLVHTLLALLGFIFIYGATTEQIIPFLPLLPRSSVDILYQPTLVIILYGLIYAALLFFAVFSSSSARAVLYRPTKKNELDQTYQEKIIQDMPLGVLIVDHDLNIIGGNPTAMIDFPFKGTPSDLTAYLSLPKVNPRNLLMKHAKSGKEKQLTWKVDTGEVLPVTLSVRRMKGKKRNDETFILFLQHHQT